MNDFKSNHGVAIVSGGLDSVTMLYYLADAGYKPHVISFDYGQRHVKELQYARTAANRLCLPWTRVNIPSLAGVLAASNSALVDWTVEVPHGHYSDVSMRATVVPNRNMIMTSIATGICIAEKGLFVAAAPHNGDAAIYPDCRPEFWQQLERAIQLANIGFLHADWEIKLPFIYHSKTQIAEEAKRLNVPVEDTWSCYEGNDVHCGCCGTCVERLEALYHANVVDPTEYTDREFWKTQVGIV